MSIARVALVHAEWSRVRRRSERFIEELGTYLRSRGHTVDIFVGTERESVFSVRRDGRTYRLRVAKPRLLSRLCFTRAEIFALRALVPLVLHHYDIVHAFTPQAVLAAAAGGQRTVFTPLQPKEPKGRIQELTWKTAIARADEICTLTAEAAAAVKDVYGRNATVAPAGIAPHRCALDRHEPRAQGRLVYIGDLGDRRSRLPALFAAFERTLQKHPDAQLALYGRGRAVWALETLGEARQHIDGRIEILPPPPAESLGNVYRSAIASIHLTDESAAVCNLLDSLACGTPVIAPGAIATDVMSGEVGAIFRPGDLTSLVDALDTCFRLAKDHQTVDRCRSHASRWRWDRVGPIYEDLYQNLSSRGG